MSENHIKDFWDNQAVTHKQSPSASWSDNWAIDLEIETIGEHIKKGDEVLDVGCANGFAALRQELKKPGSIFGIDFSEEMIRQAKEANKKRPEGAECYLDFSHGDIRNIKFDSRCFDVVYTTRVLINLPTWQEQIQGINECIRVCKKGGTIIFSEGFYEPLQKLNAIRLLSGLDPLVEHDFNRYLKKLRLELLLNQKKESGEIQSYFCNDFSSVYYFGSRFLRELLTDPSKYEGYSNPINKEFYELEKKYSGSGFGIQQAYIIKK